MEKNKHILDVLIGKIKTKIASSTSIYLAKDEDDNELLAIEINGVEKGLNLLNIVESYGRIRVYQTNSEDEALDYLAEQLANSIKTIEETPRSAK